MVIVLGWLYFLRYHAIHWLNMLVLCHGPRRMKWHVGRMSFPCHSTHVYWGYISAPCHATCHTSLPCGEWVLWRCLRKFPFFVFTHCRGRHCKWIHLDIHSWQCGDFCRKVLEKISMSNLVASVDDNGMSRRKTVTAKLLGRGFLGWASTFWWPLQSFVTV